MLEVPQAPVSACRAASCDWHIEHAVLQPGVAEATTSFELRAHHATAAALSEALAAPQSAGAVYLLGDFTAKGMEADPPTVEVAGDAVALHYARPEVLQALGDRLLTEIALTVQVRHAPGAEVSPPGPLAESGAPVPAALQGWVRSVLSADLVYGNTNTRKHETNSTESRR